MPQIEVELGGWTIRFAACGMLATIDDGTTTWGAGDAARPLVIEIGGERAVLTEPYAQRHDDTELVSTFRLDHGGGTVVGLRQRVRPLGESGIAVATTVEITPSRPLARDVTVRLPANITMDPDAEWFAPQKNGVGYVGRGGYPFGQFTWQLGGGVRRGLGGYAVLLGLPLVSLRAAGSNRRLTWCADPYFTTSFQLEDPLEGLGPELNWRYPAAVPMMGTESHTIVACLHSGDERDAIEAFYTTALPEVPPGPPWLHEIALTHFDYFSESGRGWYRDVDALAELIPERDRFRACLCLHGWYDRLGAYSMDVATRSIRPDWTLQRKPANSASGGTPVSAEQVQRMLRYARERGFRIALYYGYGLTANAAWARETFESAAILRFAGWDEDNEPSVMLNPLHPAVREWYRDYTRALLAAFGDDIDALVWDDTAFIPYGELGSPEHPGYADRAFMLLMRDIAAAVHGHRADIALLGSDLINSMYTIDGTGRDTVGYSLVADGCWQDSSCGPEAWPFMIFPNFRNVGWSCNWWPTRNIAYTHYGVWNFGAPAATSNGYGDNHGPADYTLAERSALLALFYNRPALPHRMNWLSMGDPRIPGALGRHRLPRLAEHDDGNQLFYSV